ncbi:MAG: type III-A CRISPR-associated protein Cas10/Csm1, partial [Endomicrobiia bacterium]
MSDLAADMLCREIGLPTASIILNAAGKFTLIAPNTEKVKETVYEVENKINNWLLRHFYGQSTIGISFVEASPDDLVSKKLSDFFNKMSQNLELKKFNKIDLDKNGGVINSYLDSFRNDISKPLCPFCGKRASSITNDGLLGN